MLIKSADDKSKRLKLLEELQASLWLDQQQKDWLAQELRNTRRGIAGERDAAHYIDNHFGSSKNHVLLHDLRIEVDGEVAQIDHLMMGRGFIFYLLETKNFNGNVAVNEYGEFSVEYPGERVFGIPSPLEQSRRHANVLTKLLEKLGISGRISTKPRYQHLVLVHPQSLIRRPDPKKLDTTNIIKADQFGSWHDKFTDTSFGFGDTLAMVADLRGTDTIQEWGQKIARQHKPKSLLDLPDFMAPRTAKVTTVNTAEPVIKQAPPVKKQLVCATCSSAISYPEGKFCWSNERRFGGLQYCREHQRAFT
jgi:hypothetical protein